MENLQNLHKNEQLYLEYEKNGDFELALFYFEQKCIFEKEIEAEKNRMHFQSDINEKSQKKLETYKIIYNQINEIIKICGKVNSKLKIESLIHILYEELSKVFVLDSIIISLCNENLTEIDYSVFIEKGKNNVIEKYPIGKGQTVGEYCLYNKKGVLINDINSEYELYTAKKNYMQIETGIGLISQSMLYCPTTVNGKITGYISIQSYNKNQYTYSDMLQLEILAGYLAIALENIKLYKGVEYTSATDYITGLWNRQGIIETGEKEFKKLKNNGKNFSLIMIDLDHLKKINDKFGHLNGDKILEGTAEAIKKSIRETDIPGRYGGEEFLIILPETNLEEAALVAERIRKNISENKVKILNSKDISCTASFGVYQFEGQEKSFAMGVKKADEIMYISKAKGRNQVSKYEK